MLTPTTCPAPWTLASTCEASWTATAPQTAPQASSPLLCAVVIWTLRRGESSGGPAWGVEPVPSRTRTHCPPAYHPRPSFVKLEQWLETLRMHVAGHLPLGPQLEQLDRGFWETYRRGESGLPAHREVPD